MCSEHQKIFAIACAFDIMLSNNFLITIFAVARHYQREFSNLPAIALKVNVVETLELAVKYVQS